LAGFDEKMQRGIMSLTGMHPSDFVYFSAYALFGLMIPFSSCFFMLLEGDWIAVIKVRWEDAARNHVTHWHEAQ
jgi:hypothetical protein